MKQFVRGLIFCEFDSVAWHRARSSPVCVCLYANQPAKRATCRWRHAPTNPSDFKSIFEKSKRWVFLICILVPGHLSGLFFFRPGIGLETLGSVKNRAIHPRSSDFRPHFADYSKSRDLPAVIHGYSSLAQEATTRLWWIDKSATWWTQTPCARRS